MKSLLQELTHIQETNDSMLSKAEGIARRVTSREEFMVAAEQAGIPNYNTRKLYWNKVKHLARKKQEGDERSANRSGRRDPTSGFSLKAKEIALQVNTKSAFFKGLHDLGITSKVEKDALWNKYKDIILRDTSEASTSERGPQEAANTVIRELKKLIPATPASETMDGAYDASIQHWGEWKETEDGEELGQTWSAKVNDVIDSVRSDFPDVEFTWKTGPGQDIVIRTSER